MTLLEDDVAVNCSCSLTLAVTFGAVQVWGIVSNSLILVIIAKSQMVTNNTGKMLINEAVCDLLVNVVVTAMMTANFFQRRIAVIGIPLVISLSCVKAYCFLGITFVLYMAICQSFKYRYCVSPNRILVYCGLVWGFVPVVLLFIYLEGTYYARKERYGYLQVHYTSSNWWVGFFISVNAGILPLVGSIICVYKIITYKKIAVFPSNSGSMKKIRLAKVSVFASCLHLLSLVPSQLVSGLHLSSPVAIGFGYILIFVYPSCKFFIYLHILHNFRKTAKRIWGGFCNRGTIIPTENRHISSDRKY